MANMIDLGALLPTGYAPPSVQGILGGGFVTDTCTGSGTSPCALYAACQGHGTIPVASCEGHGNSPTASCAANGTEPMARG